MSIFQKSVIKKYLAGIDRDRLEKARQIFQKNYSPEKIEKVKKLKEEEYQDGFLRDIFVDVLGYTLKPDEDFNLVREFKNPSDRKKADGAILKNDKAKAVIELKSTKTRDLKVVTEQAFNYKNNQPECKYVITSNFQKLRFYIDYANEYEEFDLFRLKKEDFELMFLILCKESILQDTPEKLKKESISHEERVSKQLYADYSVFRKRLFENLAKNNSEIDKLILFSKSQILIDRFLFIFFAEDKGLLPPNSINRIIERFNILKEEDAYKPLYEIYKQYFGYMNTGRKGKREMDDIPAYNGGLFYPDEVLYDLKIDDDVLINDLQKLSAYDFDTEVDVNILGHIFEHSLSETEETTARIKGINIDKTKSRRKKDGVFYTPRYITQYIVENTVGRLCEEKRGELDIKEIEFDDSYYTKKGNLSKKGKMLYQRLEDYKNWLLSLKILDPACGSGAFLNQALTFLIREHNFIFEIQADLKKQLKVFNVENTVLEKNLYGVDINEESVEITKLSLWLRTAHRNRKLSDLNSNIRCGNSLIDDPEIAGDKAFKWEKEFPEIMENGGFDVVIGNPPYGADITFPDKTSNESYLLFYQKSISLLRKKGYLGFITPDSWLINNNASFIREQFIQKGSISSILDVYKVFKDAPDVWCNIPIFQKEVTSRKTKINRQHPYDLPIFQFETEWRRFVDYGADRWFAYINDDFNHVFMKMIEMICVKNYFYVKRGFSPTPNKKNISIQKTKRQVIGGEDFGRYFSKIKPKYLVDDFDKSRAQISAVQNEDFIAIQRIRTNSTDFKSRWLICQYFQKGFVPIDSIGYILPSEYFHLKYLLVILNSNLLNLFYKLHYTDKNVKPIYLKKLPIPAISVEHQQPFIEKADIMLSKNKKLHELKTKFLDFFKSELVPKKITKKLESWNELDWDQLKKEMKKCKAKNLSLQEREEWHDSFVEKKEKAEKLKSVIDSTDGEIDQMVYELYGLAQEEIKTVEKCPAAS